MEVLHDLVTGSQPGCRLKPLNQVLARTLIGVIIAAAERTKVQSHLSIFKTGHPDANQYGTIEDRTRNNR